MVDYALGLNATGLESVAVTGRQNWSQRDLGSIGSMSLCTELWPQKDHFPEELGGAQIVEKPKSNVT